MSGILARYLIFGAAVLGMAACRIVVVKLRGTGAGFALVHVHTSGES